MHPRYVSIAEEVLRRLYVDEGLTAEQIAARFGCGLTMILRRLRRFDIPARARGPLPGSQPVVGRQMNRTPVEWSAETAYIVGLIATDGNLSKNGRTMCVTSKDLGLLQTVRRCLKLDNPISTVRGGFGTTCHRVQWGGRRFYDWLLMIGLTPAKSLTLGPLEVPDEYFADFFRGCIDGDGSVLVYTDRYHTTKKERYVYERLYVSLVSASRVFIEWMQAAIRRLVGVSGTITHRTKKGRRPIWKLSYAKADSIRLIRWMYYSPALPCLARKRAKAERFLSPLGSDSKRLAGRPRVGWLYGHPPMVPVPFC